jgi:hypothetical protein
MKIKFIANKITYEINTEGNYYMIGFSDNSDEPEQYVVVQRAITFDKQDIELGMDSYHFEYSDQANSGYDICKNALMESDKVVFELKDNAIDQIKSIEILFKNDNTITDKEKFKDIFDKIFSKR